jgi:hypothetical protein
LVVLANISVTLATAMEQHVKILGNLYIVIGGLGVAAALHLMPITLL